MRAHHVPGFGEERILHLAGRMPTGHVQGIEDIEFGFDFGIVVVIETQTDEDRFDLLHGRRQRMPSADRAARAGQGDVDGAGRSFGAAG